ncbi:DUF2341 domain-containing protein, partial [Candidatus Peregrinibacteria bacterium]|nr:DUF2341 domain-containing protein [Candidatus Peregrinibacteria bacterium]
MEKLSFFEKVKQTFSKAKISFRKTVQSAKRKPQALIVAAVIVGVFMTFATFALPAAVWVTQTSTNCPAQSAGSVLLSVGNYVYVLGATTGQSFWRFEPATGICNATPLADAPLSYPTWGASMEKIDDDTIYAYLGGSSRDMFMYKIAQNQWYTGPNTYADDTANSDLIPMFTTNQTSGTKVFGINNEVYYFGGSTLTKKYRPATNDWVDLTGLSIGDASSFTAIGDRIYATVSGVQFRSFDTLQSLPGTWTNEDNIPTSVSAGAAITAVGNQIYAFFGGNKTTFYRYDTTAASGSRWKTTAADNSTPLAQAPDLVYGGAALIYPGTGDYIYAFQGNNQKKFWRFDTVNNTWTSMATTPDPVGPGGSLTTDGTFIYATPGNGRHDIWRYSITNDRWNNTSDGPVMESTFFDIGVNFTLDLTTNPQKATGGITYIASGTSGGGELFVTSGIKSTSLLSGDILRLPLTGTNAYKFPLWNTPRAPVNFGEGTSLSYPGVSAEDPSGENMYLLGGATTATFFKFLLPYNTYIPWNRAKITIDGDPNVPLSQNLPLLTSSVQQSNGATMVEVDGKMYYLFGSSSRFYRFDPSTNEWKKLTDTPDTVSTGASMVKIDNNTIYVFAGANNTYIGESRADVWKYDIPNDTWLAYNIGKLNDGRTIEQNFGTAVQSYGNSMEVVDGKFYVLWGSTGGFYRYDPALNTWLMILSSSSIATGRGSSMEAVGTNIYYMTTQFGSTTLTRYNTLTNTTTNLASMAAGTPSESFAGSGNALVYPGSGDYLYAIKGYITGNNRTNRQFWRYSITGNTWVQMADTPQDMDGGTGLTILPSDPNNIYAIAGGRNKGIWRYNITGNSWSNTQTDGSTVMAQLPDEVLGGADIENDGTYLYVTQGGERYNFWRYNFATNSWSSMAEAPTEVGWTCGLNSGGNCTSDGGDLVFYDPTSGSPGSGDEEIWLTPGQGAFGPKTNSGTCFVSQTKSCGVLFRYKIATDEWPITEKPEPAPNSISSGASLTYPGSGNFIYAFKGNTSRDFWIYDFVNNRWHSMYESVLDTGENIAEPGEQFYPTGNYTLNVNQGAGNDMVEVNGKLYVAMGDSSISGGDAMFMSYDPITNTWTRLPDTPFNIFGSISHGLVKYDNNTIYLRQGAASGLTLAKYIIDADPGKAGDQGVWSVFNMGLRDDGVPLNQGDNLRTRSITYSGGKFYVLSDDSTTPFRSYDPATNEWTTLEWTPVSPNSTSDLIAVGSDEIYAILGSNNFYKYTISQNRWSVLTANSGSCSSGGGVGSSLVYHASSNYIYRIKGGSTTVVCRFNVATQTWDGTARAAAPGNIGGGGSSAIIGDNIYVTAGGGTTNFWRYNITNNRWNNTLDGDDPTNGGSTTLNDLTPSPTYGGSALTTDGTYIYATKGSKSNTFWRYDPAGTIGSRWIPMSVAPTKFNQSQSSTFSDGGELSFYDPTPGSPGSGDEEIWAVGATSYDGYNPGTAVDMNFGGALFRYKISTNTWPYLPGPQPADASSTTSSLAYSGNGTYTADDTTDILTDVSHGLGNKSKVTLSTTGTFPGNLGAGPYYVVNATVDTFQLALTPNGSAIDITSTGSGTQSYAASYIYGFFSASQFGRYDVTTNEWLYFNRPKYLGSAGEDMIQEYGFTQGLGNSVVTLNNKIYMVPGGSSERFFKYDPSTNVWTELDNLPGTTNTFTTGTTMLAMAPDLIYATNSSQFFRYNATENGWIQLTAPPASAGHGAALAYPGTGDYIYLLRGSTTTTVYKYCFQNTGSGCTVNTWGTLTATAPATIASGGSMVGVGGALYALRGNNTNTFYKFTITVPSTGEGTWSTIANMQIPSTTYTPDFTTDIFTSVGHGLYNGARITIATTGTVPGGLGAGTSYFVINKTTDTFQISTTQGGSAINFSSNGTGTQTYVTNYTAYAGASLTTDGTDIYATTGNGTSGVMKYTVGTNTWSVMPILPTGVLVSDTGGNTRGGITYVPGGPSGGAELYVSTGNDAYQTSANVSAMLYGMPFTGADANTWPMISAPADMPASITTGGALIHPGTGQRIYALQGGSTNFWSFNTETGVWNAFDPANPAATISGGASFTTDGVNRIYTARGGANPEVYAYCFTTGPNCATADVWSSLTNFRTTIGGTTDKGAVTYVSTGPSGGPELYLTTGDGQAKTVQSNSTTVPGRKLLFRYPFTGPNANTWPINNRTPLAQPDSNVAAGGSLVYSNGAFDGANGSIYALLGNATNAFRKYTITNSPNPGDGTWSAPTTSGFTGGVTVGGSLVSDGSGTTLYAMNGGATTTLQKYTITGAATGTWATLTAAPVNHGQNNGGEIVYYDGKLWMTTGKGTSEMEDTYSLNYNGLMYIYDITGNTWPFYYQAADLPTSTNTFARGSDLASIGNGLTIYALRGSPGSTPTIANPNFWRYTISGSGVGSWSTMTNMPNNTNMVTVDAGGALASIGNNNIIYATRGGNNTDFYRFDSTAGAGNEWSIQSATPVGMGSTSSSSETGDITWNGIWGNIYMTPGNDTTTSPYNLYSFPINRLVITSVTKTGGGTPIVGQSMDVTIQAVDYANNPINVSNNVDVTLSLYTGGGSIGGTTTGTITSGNNSTVITGTTYNMPEGGVVFSAADTTFPANPTIYATSNSDPFTVDGATPDITSLSVVDGPTAGNTGVTINGTDFFGHYKRTITINNPNATTYTDHPVRLIINTLDPIAEGKMRSDCGDLRFTPVSAGSTNYGSLTQLSYWIESGCNSLYTYVWVKIPTLTASTTTDIDM